MVYRKKKIAIIGFLVATIINLGILFATIGGTGILYFILILIMDHLIVLCLAFYLLIRSYIPDAICGTLDIVILKNLLILFGCWLINRIIMNFIAEKFFKYDLKN